MLVLKIVALGPGAMALILRTAERINAKAVSPGLLAGARGTDIKRATEPGKPLPYPVPRFSTRNPACFDR
jgi:hypothetical protein